MMKKIAKALFALLIVCCLVFAGMTVKKVLDQVDALNEQLTVLTAERDLLLEDTAALNEQLQGANVIIADKDEALAAKDAELTEANTRLAQAEEALAELLNTVQVIRSELNAMPDEGSADEEP